MTTNEDGTVKAVVTTSSNENGEATTKEEIFTGTEEEVKAKIDALKESIGNAEKGKRLLKR